MTVRTGRERRRGPLSGGLRACALGVLALVAVGGASAAAFVLAGGGVPIVPAMLPVSGAHSSDAVGPVVGGAELRAESWPADAQVLVDGHTVGTTPLAAEVLPGFHQVTLRRNGELEATRELDVPAAGAAVNVALWRAQPTAVKLRPAFRHERTADRTGYRNGYRERSWDTRVGTIELKVPRVRDGSFFPSLLEPRRRAERAAGVWNACCQRLPTGGGLR